MSWLIYIICTLKSVLYKLIAVLCSLFISKVILLFSKLLKIFQTYKIELFNIENKIKSLSQRIVASEKKLDALLNFYGIKLPDDVIFHIKGYFNFDEKVRLHHIWLDTFSARLERLEIAKGEFFVKLNFGIYKVFSSELFSIGLIIVCMLMTTLCCYQCEETEKDIDKIIKDILIKNNSGTDMKDLPIENETDSQKEDIKKSSEENIMGVILFSLVIFLKILQ